MFPVRELLAESLLEAGKPEEALAEFEASLRINPGRFNALYGAAKAAERAGKRDRAKQYFTELIGLDPSGRGTRSELKEARGFLRKT